MNFILRGLFARLVFDRDSAKLQCWVCRREATTGCREKEQILLLPWGIAAIATDEGKTMAASHSLEKLNPASD